MSTTTGLLLAAALLQAAGPATVRLEGRVERVDLERRSFVVGLRSGAATEAREVLLEEGAVLSSGGRTLRLEDVRPGDSVAVAVADPAARPLRARLVKFGPSQQAVPAPGPRQP
jgi:hypothetical protein